MASTKVYRTADEAVADIGDGATVLLGGFGRPGTPQQLIQAVVRRAPRDLTIVCNGTSGRATDLHDGLRLVAAGLVRKVITSFPVDAVHENETLRQWRAGKLEVECVAQGTLAERVRAGLAGLGGFWVRSGVGTPFAEGKEVREFDGVPHILERPIKADFALGGAHIADEMGNLVYRRSQRNHNPNMIGAARTSIVEVDRVVPAGGIDPADVITPGIYVRRIVVRA